MIIRKGFNGTYCVLEDKTTGRFVCSEPKFNEIMFRLYDKDRNCVKEYSLSKLIYTKFKGNKFEYRGMSTGLKDKNGKLIYEGDIVNTSNFGKCFIEWADDEAGFTLHSIETVNYYSIYCCNDFEIIGNIHENPELLED